MTLTAEAVTTRVVEPEDLTPFLGAEDSLEDDTLLVMLLAAATEKVEAYTARALIKREFTETRNVCDWLRTVPLMRAPVADVESVTVDDTEVAEDDYSVVGDALVFDPPIFASRSFVVVYTAGYAEQPSEVPPALRLAILREAATQYEHRENVVVGTIATALPVEVAGVLNPFRRLLL